MAYTRAEMQIAHMIHAVASFLMMAMFVGHIYMGTIGVKGSFQAMRTGYVDEAWAKEHHESGTTTSRPAACLRFARG